MTKLEEEIAGKTRGFTKNMNCNRIVAKAAAEVAKRYITKAIIELSDMNTERIDTNEWREKWLKVNGVI